ncbi:ABC transporter ATP-binding protein [Desulforhabdus amnigena]|jgi:putative ABC transport system ATP-binding protein|uniref:Macrolide ABC transporter ATP-binding protein n=1 Tax=Desulforhabdus amnigena TaxID=40218 RepID=A0A9W6FS96_9BACT|nr:ABC transporter ATP-binding protein [Desulforhabdus amnigena]NLJ29364.1 ABC transporter ATP-binding protein [Deltaproteobacteria bacterium]GLI34367.1 macrolide ABC transporter ATP-binding protein [Desulforhabdus amnigena]
MPFCFLKDIRKSYIIGEEEVEILKGINLQIERGEFTAIMGTSGSGKTTLMNIIGCLDVPTSGEYILADKLVSQFSDDELSTFRNEHIGFIFQNFYLLPYATVLENVLLPTLYTEKQKSGDPVKRAMELLRLAGIEDRAKFKPNQLSGGQQQRVAIARALVNDPELVLADEPTGQLDSKTANEIMQLLSAMNSKGKTVILITHDVNTAAFAKRMIRLSDGRIIE